MEGCVSRRKYEHGLLCIRVYTTASLWFRFLFAIAIPLLNGYASY